MKDISIGIAGLGFVGDALKNGLEHFGYVGIKVYDPYKFPDININNIINCDIIFVCVPTPMGQNGAMDDTILRNVLDNLNGYNGVVTIKSTVTPSTINKIKIDYSKLRIATNPEFLTERIARQDFIDTKWVIIGADNSNDSEILIKLHEKMFPKAKVAVVSPEAAMMVKYMTNVWFAVKVSLMNEFYELWNKMCDEREISCGWDDLVKAFSLDLRVGSAHLQVPGPDGDRGWGGRCYPKDLNALMALCREYDTSSKVMSAAWDDNRKYRKNKNWLKIDGAVTAEYKEV